MSTFLRACLTLGVVGALAGPAGAASLTIWIDPAAGSTESTGATASLTFTFSESGPHDLLSIVVQNTTPAATGSTLTAFGFEVPSVVSAASLASGGTSTYFDVLDRNVSVAPGWMNAAGGYDVMITSDHSFEGGNPNGGVTAGQWQSVMLSLGDTGLTPVALRDAFETLYDGAPGPFAIARFQQVGPGAEGSDKVGGRVPEPAGLAWLILGAALWQRKRSSY